MQDMRKVNCSSVVIFWLILRSRARFEVGYEMSDLTVVGFGL